MEYKVRCTCGMCSRVGDKEAGDGKKYCAIKSFIRYHEA